MIKPLYGDQTSALTKIRNNDDRKTFLVINPSNSDIYGVLVMKDKTCFEMDSSPRDLPNSVEIKTLFVSPDFQGKHP